MRENPAGSNLVPITREFGKIPGYPGGGYGYPWCAAATSIWLKAAGLKPNTDYPHTAGTLTQYSWAKKNGRWYSTPQVGDLVLYSSNRTVNGIYHVELVEKVSASSITTIGGNTSGTATNGIQGNGDGCYRKVITRSNSRIYGYVRPFYSNSAIGVPDEPEKWDGKSYPGHLVRVGDRGTEVKAVQRMLNTYGWKLAVDGEFGPATEHAVEVFQKNHRLDVDGVVGPATWKALSTPAK
ncbi:peptidoglycan-binding protein [Nonomuraea candida]|uniref:peptidoglycan-binding protein n=1 Tax=Nonomuraea candida TaxID=359159 RepID=UPI00069396D7|nr:peptidoglycan-binding protein [Nonomuraea candida]